MPSDRDVVTDEELCRQHVDGDADAIRLLVDRYGLPLFRFAFRFTGTREDAEDLVQETFIRLHEHCGHLDLSRPIKPWLYRVCGNLCRHFAEKRKTLAFSALAENDTDGEDPAAQFPDAADGPRELLEQSDAIDRVRAALSTLPAKYRIVLALFYSDDLSYEEIAHALELPINTVRTHLKRAKGALADALNHLNLPPTHDDHR